MPSSVGEIVGTQACVAGVISAYRDGGAIIQKIKIKRAQARAEPPPRLLEESIDQAPEDIDRARRQGVEQFGKAFEEGDHIAVISLQQITIQLQGTLLEKLRDAALDENDTTDINALVEAADSGRDRTISALQELGQRLRSAAPIHEVKAPSNGRQVQARQPSIRQRLKPTRTNSKEKDLPLRSANEPAAYPKQPQRQQTWIRDNSSRDVSGEEDANTGGVETDRSRKRISLSGIFKHNRSNSGSHGQVPRVSDDDRRASVSSPTSVPVPFRVPSTCDAGERSVSVGAERPNPHFEDQDLDDAPSSKTGSRMGSRTGSRKNSRPRLSERQSTAASAGSVVGAPDANQTPSMTRRSIANALSAVNTSVNQEGSTSIPTPTPDNNFLGFCKGAWKLQNGDRKAFSKCKDFNDGWSQSTVYFLACGSSKCAFAGHIQLDRIWTKVFNWEEKGLKLRWPFLAKSHVPQSRVKDKQFQYQCIFCTFLNIDSRNRETFVGANAYLEHVGKKHRGQTMGEIVLYKTGTIANRVAEDDEEFDINLWPLGAPEQLERHKAAFGSDEHLASAAKNSTDAQDSVFSVPWTTDLSDFHMGGDLERSERE